jgi:N-dimethylarginine dimethylaminohydrolase
VEAKMNEIIINPTNEAEALERIKTLPWAFSSREDGEQMISQWKAGNREEVFEALRAEIHCHEQADNWSKATYIRNVQRALQLARITLRRAR